MLYYPVKFPYIDDIISHCNTIVNRYPGAYLETIWEKFPESLTNNINSELIRLGLCEIKFPTFTFKTMTNPMEAIHIDGNAKENRIMKTAVIIPLKGCKNTKHIYYHGNYDIIKADHGWNLNWHDTPQVLGSLEIDRPYACRVDIPHTAISNGIEQRVSLSLRFKDNPTIEDVVKSIGDS